MKYNLKLVLIISIIVSSCFIIAFIEGYFKLPESGKSTTINSSNVSIPDHASSNELIHLSRTTDLFTINATVKGYSSTYLPLCRGTMDKNGSIEWSDESVEDFQWNATPEKDAPEVAERVMEPYGGIPPDAESNGASTHYARGYNLSTNRYVSKDPLFTTISYSQKDVNGLLVLGDSNFLIIDLGDYGKPLWIHKIWRNYSCSGEVPIIPLDSAIEKFDRKEFLQSEWHPEYETGIITIDIISPAYYAKDLPNNDTVLEPIWMFSGGNSTTGARLGFNVYARQFANFTASPVTSTVPLTVKFSDTSVASPERWHWDFGDGTNSTDMNPSHIYQKPGEYNVTLTAWNDLGSDTVIRKENISPLPSGTSDPNSINSSLVNASEMTMGNR